MIVCHCNVILKREIQEAVRSLLARDPSASLEPQYVYKELQKRGRCCSCFPSVAAIVSDLLADAMNDVDGVELSPASPLKQLMPKDA
ncbi:MAG: hypothetical protein AcusKO_21200 [Acuticoccus sp.]